MSTSSPSVDPGSEAGGTDWLGRWASGCSLPGVVATFDEARGLGEIESGGLTIGFHCTQIQDGSRTIENGRAVWFSVAPGLLGEWEAVNIAPA